MATSHYFQTGIPGGRNSEQLLMEDIIIECLKIYGFDVYYMPRSTVYEDDILLEDALNTYNSAYPVEMYMQNVNGFEGDGDLLTKFGVEIRDTVTFIVSRRRWEETVVRLGGDVQLLNRPSEGDVLYFPLTKSYFEIRRVEARDPFYQVGKLYVFKLECELMQFTSERVDTGIREIDEQAANKSLSMSDYELLAESGDRLLLEYFTNSSIILEDYKIDTIDVQSQNVQFGQEINILDFSERNPFGDIR